VSSSGGNAGLAAAYAAQAVGLPATVVLPESTAPWVADRLEDYGAKAIFHGRFWDEANELAKDLCEEQNGVLIHPFEGEDTWDGHATLVHELFEQLDGPPSAVVTVCGGGGLLMGILRGTHLCI